ncbi:hypothetical protein TcasGA2_TC002181 [Tribolium castaneum]|uniref:DDE Tnp4 domain-containing protein n=1 Tax=Tribolium castaneum TaxID=7070 RepID=D6WY67_TRICA|nr:hypothetical protein TcasGA2_TC002181 [Tribolium castaneum]
MAKFVIINYKLCSIRLVIERAFARLKGKFRRLKYLDISDPNFGPQIVATACVLHNFIILKDNDDEEFENVDEFLNNNENDDVAPEEQRHGIQKRLNIMTLFRDY